MAEHGSCAKLAKIRIDTLLYSRGLAASREKARAMIMAGEVRVNESIVTKPGTLVEESAELRVESLRGRYVSRGGFKLEGAIQDFQLDFRNKTVLDIGASTGGYTDCALQHGARKVFAVDVGYGQLDWNLRQEPRVVVLERKNARFLTRESLGEMVDIITMDVSFISITLIFPVLKDLLKEEGEIVTLIKPQFEAGKNRVGKKGVIKDPLIHREVLLKCINAAKEQGLYCIGVSYSPIKGPQGNIEFFAYLSKHRGNSAITEERIREVVERAHVVLGG